MTLIYIILATLIISTLSFVGILLLTINPKLLQKSIFYLVGLSTGTLLGGAFFHLIPESLETSSFNNVAILVLSSFAVFFLIEKVLHWHHSHDEEEKVKPIGYLNLIGDGIHNFIDGLIIAAAFTADVRLGVVSSVALVFHEIPQELGDFGVLTFSGMRKNKALMWNFLVALTSVVGGVLGFFLLEKSQTLVNSLLPLAAGSFLYISASDLIPELKQETNLKKSLISFVLFLIGLILMFFLASHI